MPEPARRIRIRPVVAQDREWVRKLMRERWAGEEQVVDGEVFRPAELAGFVAVEGAARVGLVTYRIEGDVCMLGTLDSLDEGRGVGTALVNAARAEAALAGCARLRVVTTNDNRCALGFYRSAGFRVTVVREGAVDESRKLKPSIPLVGEDGIPITDEVELELTLARAGP
jgi:ribosomal protein S18 acetylase RimI-like enzyme